MLCKNCMGKGTTTQYDDGTGPVGQCPICKGLIKRYRVWNVTKEQYQLSNTCDPFYKDQAGARLGIRRMKEFYRLKDHTFEIREYIAMPTSLIHSIIKWIEEADNETPLGDNDRKYIIDQLSMLKDK